MSIATGTATDYLDLLAKLVTFLTTDSALVTAGQNWSVLASATPAPNGDDKWVFLKAPGLSGAEQIYINIAAWHDTSAGMFNWTLTGAAGYNSAQGMFAQPNVSPILYSCFWNNSIPYTFIANGQRVIVIAQIGSVFESFYAGKINTYGTPSQYPYPLFIGGSTNQQIAAGDTSFSHSAFFDPNAAYLCWVDGTWQLFRNRDSGGGINTTNTIWPWAFGGTSAQAPTQITTDLDGGYSLLAARLEMTSPAPNMPGELDGVFFTPGTSLSSGSTVAVGSDTYLALQNIFRTAINNFALIKEA